jgi:hypothetical protein
MLSQRLKGALIAANVAQLEYRTVVSTTTDASSYTFSGVDIGTASADRLVIVIVHTVTGVGGNINITGVTIAGVSATQRVINAAAAIRMAIYTALVSSGATGNIVVTTDVTAGSMAVSTYTLKTYNSSTPESTLATSGTPTPTGNLTFGSGGAVVAGSTSGNAATTTSWSSPLTENYDVEVEDRPRSGASASNLSAQTLTVSATANPSAITQMVAAAWR